MNDSVSQSGGAPLFSGPETSLRYGANLPHLRTADGIYFVTYRLSDSLPSHVLARIRAERDAVEHQARREGVSIEEMRRQYDGLFSERIERYLDTGAGACWMKHPQIAATVRESLCFFDTKRYELIAWCVMPNHVHAVLHPLHECTLEQILHTWKSYSAKVANKKLNRSESFWQPESYDHLIRDQQDLNRHIEYTWNNPDAAGLHNWPWRGCIFDMPAA